MSHDWILISIHQIYVYDKPKSSNEERASRTDHRRGDAFSQIPYYLCNASNSNNEIKSK